MIRTPEQKRARRIALARARKCTTCRRGPCGYGEPRDGIGGCINCHELIGYYSCAPGYCRACAHDPAWVPIADVWPEAIR